MTDEPLIINLATTATNLLLVERVAGIARAMGRPVATCAQARRRIGLGDPPRA